MQQKRKLVAAWFSPTHASRAVVRAVADGYCEKAPSARQEIDMTHELFPGTALPAESLLVVGVPVYGGSVAPLALERLSPLRGHATPVVAVVTYGNRSFGKAVVQLSAFLEERGFRVVAAGAFVGEHSYHTAATPIAAGRPTKADLSEARLWGAAIARKLSADGVQVVDAACLKCPSSGLMSVLRFAAFVWKYRRRMKRRPVKLLPVVDSAACMACGRCAQVCPTGAVSPNDFSHTDAALCIKCAACSKACPAHARTLSSPFAPVLSKNFSKPKPNVYLL